MTSPHAERNGGAQPPRPATAADVDAAFAAFLDLFNRGEYWDSHEALEAAWRRTGSEFYHALILFSTAGMMFMAGARDLLFSDELAVEGGMLRLAEECGIRTPETRLEALGDEQILLVKRFDREPAPEGGGEYRHRMVSALTVLDLDDSVTDRSGWSYPDLADELQRLGYGPVSGRVGPGLFRRDRNAIERMFGRIKDFRRIATRYDRLCRNFLAAVCLVATVCYWL